MALFAISCRAKVSAKTTTKQHSNDTLVTKEASEGVQAVTYNIRATICNLLVDAFVCVQNSKIHIEMLKSMWKYALVHTHTHTHTRTANMLKHHSVAGTWDNKHLTARQQWGCFLSRRIPYTLLLHRNLQKYRHSRAELASSRFHKFMYTHSEIS